MSGYLEAVRQAGERARELVEQILVFGRRRVPVRKPVPLRSLLVETASLIAASMPAHVKLVICDVPETAVVSGQPTQLQQIILNLFNNAAQAMDGAGIITLITEIRHVTRELIISHGRLTPRRYVRIAMRDSGRGIDEETLERMFEPFFTTRQAGNGLGLATVRAIVSEHDGAMNVESTLGKGSLFEVWLPQTALVQNAPTLNLPVVPRGGGETVMIIDDDSNRLMRHEDIVAALGYEPVGFAHPSGALAAYRSTPARFDAILIGHVFPLDHGLEFAAELREIAPNLPILLAATADEVGADLLATAGISDLVARPLTSPELASALERCLTFSRRTEATASA